MLCHMFIHNKEDMVQSTETLRLKKWVKNLDVFVIT